MYKIIITTSGTGSRLKGITQNKNKALIDVGNIKVIDHIINSYNSNLELIITVGYFAKEVTSYIKKKYSDRSIRFIPVEPFEGPGSSLGYSLLQAKNSLQCPFVFHCNDTIIKGNIPSPEHTNWNGVSNGLNAKIYNTNNYSSVVVENGHIKKIQMKGAKEYDAFHIGLVGIKDYKEFWEKLENNYKKNPLDATLNDVSAISEMIQEGLLFKAIEFKEWYDTGNLDSLNDTNVKLNSF